ncbi:hypothetical protein SHAb15599_00152 [Acinetobacter phage SH-Ab 15599]|nr:hypothetical protein SHAb15599_00152 [Acinetobacter phage SH-Ab 15599]
MADVKLPSIYPRGVGAKSLIGIDGLKFSRNFGSSRKDVANIPVNGDEYLFVVDSKQTISGLYFITFTNPDNEKLMILASANGRQSADSGSNTLNILSISNPGPIYLKDVDLRANASTDVGLLLKIGTNGAGTHGPLSCSIVHIGSQIEVSPNLNYNNYTNNIDASIINPKNILRVDDITNVDLNNIKENSINLCQPASVNSRPDFNGVGVCMTFAFGDKVNQIFVSENRKMYFRSTGTSWEEALSDDKYPKLVKSGIQFVAAGTGTQLIRISVGNIDLTNEAYVINMSTQYDNIDLSPTPQIADRGYGFFDIVLKTAWAGVINYNISEAYAPSNAPRYNMYAGRLDGSDTTPVTSVEEGQTVRFVLSTLNVPNGTLIPFLITGVTETDIGIPLSGNFTIMNSSGVIDVPVIKDMTPEGQETMTLTLQNGSGVSASMIIQDTSIAPEFNVYFSSDIQGNMPVTDLKDGFVLYVQVVGIVYDPQQTYRLSFEGSDFASSLINSVPNEIDVSLDNNGRFYYPLLFNQPVVNEIVINISTDMVDLNLYNFAKSKGVDVTNPVNIKFTQNYGTVVVASSTAISAITVGDFPYGSKIKYVNFGSVWGRGGQGGYAISPLNTTNFNGEDGGSCISGSNNNFLIFENYGVVAGGGGGGGASGVGASTEMSNRNAWHPIVAGSGGAPYGITPKMMYTPQTLISPDLQSWPIWTDAYDFSAYSKNDKVYRRYPSGQEVQTDVGPVGNATTAPQQYDPTMRPMKPGNGGDIGADGSDGIFNYTGTWYVALAPGKGGLKGKIIETNEHNVDIRNYSGWISGR